MSLRSRIIQAASSPFRHAAYPLARSLDYRGDPGLFGPGAVSWRVIGDVATFIGGIRALLVQAAHPEVVAGVEDHSRYREDPLGRLSRTSSYVTATTFGAMPEVEEAVAMVRRAHRRVAGTSHRGIAYTADHPAFAAWVHNALTDSFLVAYQTFGPEPLTIREADQFVSEQAVIGRMLDADPVPETADELAAWVAQHPAVAASPGMREAVEFLVEPPLDGRGQRVGYRLMQNGAVSILPPRIRTTLGLPRTPAAIEIAGAVIASLRWAMGSSPSWHLALVRTGAPVPPKLFSQPLPVDL